MIRTTLAEGDAMKRRNSHTSHFSQGHDNKYEANESPDI